MVAKVQSEKRKVKSNVKKGDTVKVLRGKDRGKQAKVMQVFPGERRVLVEGVQLVKKHVRPRKAGQKAQRVTVASAIPIASVQLVCTECKKPTRVGRVQQGDARVRSCKKCGAALP